MKIFTRSIVIWLITNISGTILISATTVGNTHLDDSEFFVLFLILGLAFSLPAIPFTYYNFLFISKMHSSKCIKYIYTFISTLAFICIATGIIYIILAGGIDFRGLKSLWAHTLMAVLTTLWFASGIIDSNILGQQAIKYQKTNIHKL